MFCICPRDSRGETDIRESGLPSKWCRWGPGYPLLIYHSHSHLYDLCVTWWRNLQSVFIQTVALPSIQMVFFTCMPTKPNKKMIFFSLFFNYGVIFQEEKVNCFSVRHSKDLSKLCSISQDMPEHIMHPHLSLNTPAQQHKHTEDQMVYARATSADCKRHCRELCAFFHTHPL